MPDELILPPDAGTRYRSRAARWVNLFDREGVELAAPNYAAWVAQIVTGLYQAQPPTVTAEGRPLGHEDDELTDHTVDMLEDAGEMQAGTGLAVLRPVFDGVRWSHQVLGPGQVAPTWEHRRLSGAVVWTLHRHPGADKKDKSRVAIVEYWGTDPDGNTIPAPTVRVADGEIDAKGEKFTAPMSRVFDAPERLPSKLERFAHAFGDGDNPDRVLVPVVWKWAAGDPVPIYFRNEGVIGATEKLHDVEQTDAIMVRKRVAISKDLLGRNDVTYGDGDGGKVIARAGWQLESNLLLLDRPAGSWNEDGGNAPFEVIEFSDDLTQAERIEYRRQWVLAHCGINPQSVGMNVGGRSDSAAAKRADQQMTMNTVSSPARRLSQALSVALTQEATLNAAPTDVRVTVHEGVKPVLAEAVDTAARMDAADLASTRTIVETANPGRTDEWYDQEVDRMIAEGRATAAPDMVPDDTVRMGGGGDET